MKIRELPESDNKEYDELAMRIGSVFYTTHWTNIFENRVHQYGIYNNGNKLVGGFSLYREKKYGLSVYCNPAFTPSVGPFLKVDALNPAKIMATWKEAVSAMADFIEKLPYAVISFSLNTGVLDMQPFIWKKYKVIPNYTYIIDLNKSYEDIMKDMSVERRNDIRKAIRDKLETRQIDDPEQVRLLVMTTFQRQGKSINEYYLKKILNGFTNDKNSFSFATFDNETPISCAFCIYDEKKAYYILGGYNSEMKHHGAGALTIWEAIKHASKIGLKYFDFEGSMVPQIERYFRDFGGQLTPYYRINKARLPLEIVLKFFKRDLF